MTSRLLIAYPEAGDKAIVRARTSPLEGAGHAFSPIRWAVGHVRFGLLADIPDVRFSLNDVRFTPESRHWAVRLECLLRVRSRHMRRTTACPLYPR